MSQVSKENMFNTRLMLHFGVAFHLPLPVQFHLQLMSPLLMK